MKISIDFDGIQEGKNYVFQFSLSSDGQVVMQNTTTAAPQVVEKKSGAPSLEDFENREKPPVLEDSGTRIKKEFKVESSFDGKLGEGKSL